MSDFDHKLLHNVKLNCFYEIKEYKKNEIIYSEGEKITSVGLILMGEINISSTTLDGYNYTISNLSKNDIFGDTLILNNESYVLGNITSLTTTKILFIYKDNFLSLLKDETFNQNYLKIVSNRIQALQYRIKLISQPSIREKIMFYLKDEMRKQKSNKIYLHMTKEKLAILLNINRPSLSRELIKLKKEKVIDYDYQSITINNIPF